MTADPASFEEADDNLGEMLDSLAGADNYLDFLTELFRPHLAAPLLEVGAGHGDLTTRMSFVGSIRATDISERCVDRLVEKFDADDQVTVEYLNLDFPLPDTDFYTQSSVGSIVMVNVLEHIEDDVAALARLRDTLEPGGVVIVFVPAFQMLYGRFDQMIGHHRRYRTASLRKAFVDAGLEPVDLRYVNLPGWFAWLITVRLLRILPTDSALVRLYDRLVIPIVHRIERRVRPPFGQSVLGIARR